MRRVLALAAMMALSLAGGAFATEVEVKMLNKGQDGPMVFEPALVKIAPGDTVKFVSVDKGHNAESVPGMLPEGATPFSGKVSQDLVVTFDKPGVYGYRCTPHYGMGMVGIVAVGDAVSEDKAKAVSHPGKANQAFSNLFCKLADTKSAMN